MLVYDVHIFYYFSIYWSDTSLADQIMLHFIRVYTVCKGIKIFRQKNTFFLIIT